MHLSGELDAGASETVTLVLSHRYMDADAYFDLEAFSYHPRGYGRRDFDADIALAKSARLPLRVKWPLREEGTRQPSDPEIGPAFMVPAGFGLR